MPGDRALSMLIDIKSRDSASGVVRMLGGLFSGFAASLGKIGMAFKLFDMGAPITGMKALAEGIKGVMAASLELLGLITLVGAAIALALGVVAFKAAANFQQGLNRLITGAGDVTDNMGLMGQSILGVSIATGVLTDKLLPAMYQIISAGQRGAEAENTLAVAARGAVAEQANVVDVAKALTGAMTDYGTAQFNAVQYMNMFTRATQLGKLTLEQLSNSMGPLLPIARNLGIHIQDVAAAMSTMTNANIPADRAATSLRFLFQSLENPTKKATAAMVDMGLNTVAVANEMKTSLPAALQMIWDAAKQAGPQGSVPFNRAVSDMIGGQRSLQAFLSLTGTHFATYVTNTKAVTDAMKASRTAVLGWDTAQKNLNVKLSQAWAAIQAVFIAVGTQLLPKLGPLADIVTKIAQHFADWVNSAKPLTNLFNQIGQAIDTVWPPAKKVNAALSPMADAFDRATGAMKTIKSHAQPMLDTFDRASGVIKKTHHEAVNPFVGALLWLRDAWDKVKNAAIAVYNWFVPIGNFIAKTLTPYIQQIGFIITTVLVPAWNAFVKAIKPYLPTLLLLAEIVGVILVAALIIVSVTILLVVGAVLLAIGIFLALVAAVLFAATWVHDKIKWLVDTVVGFFKWLWQQLIGGSIIPDIVNGIVKWFTKARDFLVGLWNGLKDKATQIWNAIAKAISDAIEKGKKFIQDKWNAIIKWIIDTWNKLVSTASTLGANFVNAILKGIQNAWSSLTKWLTDALAKIMALFPHSPVKAGPLRGFENWGYTFGMGIADGIRRSIPAVQSAALLLAASMGGNYSGSYSLSGSSFGGGRYPTGGVTVVHNHIVVMPPDVKLDGASVTDRIMQRAGTDVRRHGGPIKWG